jgi:hypothetical protein
VSGGTAADFSGAIFVIGPDGSGPTERARGFGFAAGVDFDLARDELLVLDAAFPTPASAVTGICRDADTNGSCDAGPEAGEGVACTPCGAPTSLDAAKLTVSRLLTPPGDDVITLKGELILPSANVNPQATGMRIAIADPIGHLLGAIVPPNAPWKSRTGRGGTRFKTKVDLGGPIGRLRVVLKTPTASAGLVKVLVKATGASWPGDPSLLPLRATLSLVPADGVCGEATFTAEGQSCTFNEARGKIDCR